TLAHKRRNARQVDNPAGVFGSPFGCLVARRVARRGAAEVAGGDQKETKSYPQTGEGRKRQLPAFDQVVARVGFETGKQSPPESRVADTPALERTRRSKSTPDK